MKEHLPDHEPNRSHLVEELLKFLLQKNNLSEQDLMYFELSIEQPKKELIRWLKSDIISEAQNHLLDKLPAPNNVVKPPTLLSKKELDTILETVFQNHIFDPDELELFRICSVDVSQLRSQQSQFNQLILKDQPYQSIDQLNLQHSIFDIIIQKEQKMYAIPEIEEESFSVLSLQYDPNEKISGYYYSSDPHENGKLTELLFNEFSVYYKILLVFTIVDIILIKIEIFEKTLRKIYQEKQIHSQELCHNAQVSVLKHFVDLIFLQLDTSKLDSLEMIHGYRDSKDQTKFILGLGNMSSKGVRKPSDETKASLEEDHIPITSGSFIQRVQFKKEKGDKILIAKISIIESNYHPYPADTQIMLRVNPQNNLIEYAYPTTKKKKIIWQTELDNPLEWLLERIVVVNPSNSSFKKMSLEEKNACLDFQIQLAVRTQTLGDFFTWVNSNKLGNAHSDYFLYLDPKIPYQFHYRIR